MALSRVQIPWLVVLSYIVDWVAIIIIAAIGGGLSFKTPASRLFSPLNPAISYPYAGHGISTGAMFVLCVLMPAIIIVAISAVLPLPRAVSELRTGSFWRGRLWEINAGWLGLALANALAVVITQTVKACFGKPRPDFLDRCQPDLTGIDLNGLLPSQLLLDRSSCTQINKSTLDDGFRSFFSGHSSSSFAGLLYFSLWLALKFNIVLPRPGYKRSHAATAATSTDSEALATRTTASSQTSGDVRTKAAAPPVWGAIIFFAPILLATWIASTRWIEYKHDGWDVGFGILFGALCAVVGFRWYHADPVLSGESWTWAPRGQREAFLLRPETGRGSGIAGAQGVAYKDADFANGRTGSTNGAYHGVPNGAEGVSDGQGHAGQHATVGSAAYNAPAGAASSHAPVGNVQPYPQA